MCVCVCEREREGERESERERDMCLEKTLLELGVPSTEIITSPSIPASAVLVKSLIWRVTNTQEPVVFVLKQEDTINYKQAERLMGGKVTLSTKVDASSLSGYSIGQIPPYGHLQPMPVYVDSGVLSSSRTVTTQETDLSVEEDEEDEEGEEREPYPGPGPLVYMGTERPHDSYSSGSRGSTVCLSLPLSRLLLLPGVTVADLTSPTLPVLSSSATQALSQLQLTEKSCGAPSHHTTPMTRTETSLSSCADMPLSSFHKLIMRCKSRQETPTLYDIIAACLSLYTGKDASALAPDPSLPLPSATLATLRNAAGKNALHLAAWRGSVDVLDLLLPHVHIDTISTGCGNYG